MNTYSIKNTTSGADLGLYTGETPAAALDRMSEIAGYRDLADVVATTGENGSDLRVTLVAEGRVAREVQDFRDGFAEGFRAGRGGIDGEPIGHRASAADREGQLLGRVAGRMDCRFSDAISTAETVWLAAMKAV